LIDIPAPDGQRSIPRLAHGLDRVLFSPSVHWLQDPHSRVFNFPPALQTLPPVTDFAFERLPGYVSSSKDQNLHNLAIQHSKQFSGTTSSLTKFLTHIYFLISGDRSIDISSLSMAYSKQLKTFTPGLRIPATFTLHHRRHLKTGDEERLSLEHTSNSLLQLGTMTEKFLTLSAPEFNSLLRKNPDINLLSPEKKGEAYRYCKSSKFVMRSQLDCQDSRLPGSGVFDIKTRAVLPIRIDQLNYQANSGYLIRKMTGLLESFEREYYDLIRGAFLKYNFQARIGAMDGVFVAYHNTARIFGFQYVPVKEMDERLYGPGPPERGDKVFEKCVGLMEELVSQIVTCFPGKSVSCTVDAEEGTGQMLIWVTPTDYADRSPPIIELKVTVSHTVNGRAVNSQIAINRAPQNWVMAYEISRSARPEDVVWNAFRKVQAREFKQNLPEGVTHEQMSARLANVNWGAGQG
ncbi:Pet127-domain-containing protein, partial [Ramaria rubella]